MPAQPQLLAGVLAIQTALQGIATASGYFYDVPAGNIVLDPVDLATVASAPFGVLGGNISTLSLQKELMDLSGTKLQDTLTLPFIARVDAPGSDFVSKFTAYVQWISDVEKAMATAAFGPGQVLNGLTVVAWPKTVAAASMGDPSNRMVIVTIELSVKFKLRTNGQP